jgi:LCP family protein required for cell wall assembly
MPDNQKHPTSDGPKTSNIDGIIKPNPVYQNQVSRTHKQPGSSHTPASHDKLSDAALTQTQLVSNQAQPKPLINASPARDPSLLDTKEKSSAKSKRFKKLGKKKVWFLSGLAVLLLLVGFGAWDAWQLYHKLNHLHVGDLTASVGGAENILVAGSTNRCNLKVQNAQWGFCSQGVTGINSDIIFIVHLDPATHKVSLLSIPRDTFIPDARQGNEAFKIDAALYQGPTQLVNAVQQDFGIPIQHYVEVGFDGFVNIVNALGGIKMDFPMPVYDAYSYLNVQTAGCRLLNGDEALRVVRARHLQYKPPGVTTDDVYYWPQEVESDLARITRTHEFLRVLASTIASKNLSNPVTDQKMIDAIAPQVQVDSGFSTSDMLTLIQAFESTNINNVPQYTLPIATTNFGDYYYEDEDMGDVVFPVEPNDEQITHQFLDEASSLSTMSGQSLPAPNSINLNVINGSGTADQATQTSQSLASLGFKVASQPGTAQPVSSQAEETVVYYANANKVDDALAVANKLSGYVIISLNHNMVSNGSNVTVLTGSGLSVTAPPSASPSTSSSSSAAASTSQASTALSNAEATDNISPASSATQPLSPWDPRACVSN